MLQTTEICGRVGCTNRFDRVRGKIYCCRKCQHLAKNALVPHSTLISSVESLNKLGTGMVLVRFGITNPTSQVVRWFPGLKTDLSRPAFPLPMINLPYDLLPGSGLYNLAFYGADQKLALEPKVRISINMPTSRAVQFSEGTLWLHKELPTRQCPRRRT
jgi:hypothetical protein